MVDKAKNVILIKYNKVGQFVKLNHSKWPKIEVVDLENNVQRKNKITVN